MELGAAAEAAAANAMELEQARDDIDSLRAKIKVSLNKDQGHFLYAKVKVSSKQGSRSVQTKNKVKTVSICCLISNKTLHLYILL